MLLLALYAAVLLPARHETPRPACAPSPPAHPPVRGSSRLTTKLIGGGVWPSYLGAPAFHGATGQDRDVDKSELLGRGGFARTFARAFLCLSTVLVPMTDWNALLLPIIPRCQPSLPPSLAVFAASSQHLF